MNLVFFDIECASVFKYTAKICAFGYLICDEQFNILKKEDILINPKGKFHLTNRNGSDGLVLPYDYEKFKNFPLFDAVYPKIKALLEDKNNVCIGHSTLNDIKYLDLETKRYNLPSFCFEFSDTQLMYMTLRQNYQQQKGLEAIAAELGVEFVPHRAADDAYATMRVCQAMCQKQGCSFKDLEKMLDLSYGKIENHEITLPHTGGQVRFLKENHRQKVLKARNREKLFQFINRKKCKKNGEFKGKIFNFSTELENDFALAKNLIGKIYDNGGTYVHKLSQCNTYVYTQSDCTVRKKMAESNEAITLMSLEELEQIINVN